MLTSIAKFVDVDMPAAPALPSAPRHQLQGCLLGPLQRKDDAAARHGLYLIDPIEYGYGWVAASAVAHELNAAGIWSTVYESRHELNAAIIAKGVDLSRVALDPADFVANEPYVGPVHTDFMHETSIRDILDEGAKLARDQPCELLAKVVMGLGPTLRSATEAIRSPKCRSSARPWPARCATGGSLCGGREREARGERA